MSNARYPTLVQVLPFFHLLRYRLNKFLDCSAEAAPDYDALELDGKPYTLARAIKIARQKLEKYFKLAQHPKSPHSVATGI